jgi:hypothetical protein
VHHVIFAYWTREETPVGHEDTVEVRVGVRERDSAVEPIEGRVVGRGG